MSNTLEASDIAKRWAPKDHESLEQQIMELVGRKIVEPDFAAVFNATSISVNENAKSKGWWDEERNDGEMIALMHSELSEGLEALRHGNQESEHIPAFNGLEEELADVVIRIMDMAAARGLDVGGAIVAKMAFNTTRPIKHGGKKF